MNRPTILIVDDQPLIRISLGSILSEYRVVEASDGNNALAVLEEFQPDLIILDLNMPGMDGYTTLSILKDSLDSKSIPIIVLTSTDDIEEKIKCLEIGADDYLTKPFNSMELRARVSSLLRARSRYGEMNSVQDFVLSLVKALGFRDSLTSAHSQRTAFYAMHLATRLHTAEAAPHDLHLGGLLHDIGKLGIREWVLNKQDPLESNEFELIKFHPVIGERICSPVAGLRHLLPFIRHHHERWDGNGYPDGLLGPAIPLGARIIALAEGFDTMTSNAPYREALSTKEALEILRWGAGAQWDPELVGAFCTMVRELGTLPINVRTELELSQYF